MKKTLKILTVVAVVGLGNSACKKEEGVQVAATALAPEPAKEAPAGGQPAGGEALPPGHPPMGAPADPQGLPPGHPSTAGVAIPPAATPVAGAAADTLAFTAPAAWQERPTRPMLAKVYAAPKADGDAEDAEVTLSFLSANIPLDANIQRWCGQFDLEGGKPCAQAATQAPLAGATFPTTVVEMAGAFKAGSMAGPAGAPKPGFKLVVVSISTPTKTWFVKLTGPAKTVAQWKEPLLAAVKAIK